MNIFEAIRADHDIQRELLDKALDTSGDTQERKKIWEKLKVELKGHETAEERNFYKQLIDNDMMVEHTRHGIAEHHEIDELITKVDESEMDSSAWLAHLKALDHQVRHHLEDEEKSFFQMAGKVFSESQKTELAKKYNAEMEIQRKEL
ncbi:hemerythrin domain-containing protein [Marinirhabdus gelatinilytica]|uniref:Hemerythrin HHE cation binding domain-containing protein n=1 Tax=Marinirhabdus gelatinilytica TaxID=1703343 RepID=A0A370QKZ7_9FLAO|nr:hemerythrin domain-containing protein [Marinirhabdus gelatinilytica]RDK89054.1 hemerythrin HHE cation binding domain-containing protein [Marinirhabdus gelatinilytica]